MTFLAAVIFAFVAFLPWPHESLSMMVYQRTPVSAYGWNWQYLLWMLGMFLSIRVTLALTARLLRPGTLRAFCTAFSNGRRLEYLDILLALVAVISLVMALWVRYMAGFAQTPPELLLTLALMAFLAASRSLWGGSKAK